jgi:hypothetical protein
MDLTKKIIAQNAKKKQMKKNFIENYVIAKIKSIKI